MKFLTAQLINSPISPEWIILQSHPELMTSEKFLSLQAAGNIVCAVVKDAKVAWRVIFFCHIADHNFEFGRLTTSDA